MIERFFKKSCMFALRIYSNYVSYFFPSRCRFYPSCSHYALGAIEIHGTLKGLLLTVHRLFRCHPWHKGGLDPVPEKIKIFHSPCCVQHNSTHTTKRNQD